ncbi:MAG TPA: hypothetical protein VGM90_01290 [Kofleriaceae bacterium]
MSGWKIVEWSREKARGAIESNVGRLPFDGHVALVDDFRIGETVEIRLMNGAVTRIAPISARSVVENIPANWPHYDKLLARFSSHMGMGSDLVIVGAGGDRLELELWDHEWWPPSVPALAKVTFHEVTYVQLEMRTERFSRITARAWGDVRNANPPWIRELSIGLDDVDTGEVLFVFEDDTFGARPGFVIASSVT